MYLWIGCWEEKNKNENNERPAKGKLMGSAGPPVEENGRMSRAVPNYGHFPLAGALFLRLFARNRNTSFPHIFEEEMGGLPC